MLLSTMGIRPMALSCPKATSPYHLSHTESWCTCLHRKPKHVMCCHIWKEHLEPPGPTSSSLQEYPFSFVISQKLLSFFWNMLHILSLFSYQLIHSFLATWAIKYCLPPPQKSTSFVFFKCILQSWTWNLHRAISKFIKTIYRTIGFQNRGKLLNNLYLIVFIYSFPHGC